MFFCFSASISIFVLALPIFVLALPLSAHAQMMMTGDGTNMLIKNGGTTVATITPTGQIEASTPTANSHLATKEHVDTQLASASGGGGIMCTVTRENYQGDLGGPSGADAKCASEFDAGWAFSNHSLMVNVGNSEARSILNPSWAIAPSNSTCSNWSSTSSNGTFLNGTTTYTTGSCSSSKPLFCCKY